MPGQPSSRSSTIASMSVSRSLPGSSRMSTLGSSRIVSNSDRRRRWPPERSPMRLQKLLGRKAQTLAELLGRSLLAVDDVVLLIVAENLADRVAHVGLELLELLRQHAKAHRLANLHAAARGLNLA